MFGLILTLICLFASSSAFIPFANSRIFKSDSSLQMGNLVENFRFVKHFNRFTFKTLYKCIAACGLEDALSAPGPNTVFAPTDAAFADLPAGKVDELLADIPTLKSILLYHVVPGAVSGDAVKATKKLTTLNGAGITISVEADKLGDRIYTDDAKVLTTDVTVDNGLIHIIDMIMIPGACAGARSADVKMYNSVVLVAAVLTLSL